MGLDAGSREVLLDLIYRLSLDDKASDGKARAPGDGAAKERHRKERSGDDEDDEARRLRARAKEARDLMGFNLAGLNVLDAFIRDNEEVKDDLVDDEAGL